MKHAKMGCVDRHAYLIFEAHYPLLEISRLLPIDYFPLFNSFSPHTLFASFLFSTSLLPFDQLRASDFNFRSIKWRTSKEIPVSSYTITIPLLRQQWCSFSFSWRHPSIMSGKWSGKEHGSSRRSSSEESVSDEASSARSK